MQGLKSLRGQAYAAAAISISVLLLLAGVGVWGLYSEGKLLDGLGVHISDESDKVVPLLLTTKDVRNDVVQVQQWLSDISATRGLDGLNDGITLAGEFANKFDQDVAKATKLAQSMGYGDIVTALANVRAAFGPYFTVGKKMAEAYISSGPEGGNPLMGEFDTHAENINREIAKMTELVDGARTSASEGMINSMEAAQDSSSNMMMVTLVVFVIGLAILSMMAFRMLKIANVISEASQVLAHAKDGDLNGRILNIRAKDESGEMQRNVNRILDRMEAFSRESMAAMASVSKGRFYRKILDRGMVGDFKISADAVNTAVTSMGVKAAAEKDIEVELTGLVSSVAAGDFTQRIGTNGKDGFFLSLSEGINEISASVQRGVDELTTVLESMSDGKLTVHMTQDYQGAFDDLKTNSNTMADRLKGIVQDIRGATDTVNTASAEIAEGSSDLASRTEQQASNLEETAAAMEELSASVRNNADNSKEASQLSSSARDAAEEGGGVVSTAVQAMSRIEESSTKISDIVNLIDEIAFQTNLLALNAAVEAARAGDAGKGFAVVASEVRALAQRSSAASKEIKSLIDHSGSQVQEGVKLVNQTGKTLEGIVVAVKKVADIVAEISSASQEQAAGLEEVNTAVSNMDEMTQQNAALVEQTTAAAQSLEDQANGLTRMVAFFDTGDGGERIELPSPTASTGLNLSVPEGAQAPSAPPSPRPAAVAPFPVAESVGEDSDWQEF